MRTARTMSRRARERERWGAHLAESAFADRTVEVEVVEVDLTVEVGGVRATITH